MESKKSSALWSLLILLGVLVLMLFVFAPLQMAYGLWGLAWTELGLLAVAVGSAVALHIPLHRAFRFARPTLRDVGGVVLLWLGGFWISMAATCVVMILFPAGMAIGESLNNLFTSLPLGLAWVIVALMPAVCEEALHRGVMQATFSGFQSRWAVVVLMGLLFGLFHLDPYRFLATTVLGMCLSYLMEERQNLVLPMLFHLINNTVSVLSAAASEALQEGAQAVESTVAMPLETVGVMMILSSVAVFLLRGGAALLQSPERRAALTGRRLMSSRIFAAAVALALLLAGSALVAASGV